MTVKYNGYRFYRFKIISGGGRGCGWLEEFEGFATPKTLKPPPPYEKFKMKEMSH